MMETKEEPFNPFINAALVVRLRIQDLGRLEEYIAQLKGAELFFVEKCPKSMKLRIIKEKGENENDRSSGNNRQNKQL